MGIGVGKGKEGEEAERNQNFTQTCAVHSCLVHSPFPICPCASVGILYVFVCWGMRKCATCLVCVTHAAFCIQPSKLGTYQKFASINPLLRTKQSDPTRSFNSQQPTRFHHSPVSSFQSPSGQTQTANGNVLLRIPLSVIYVHL